MAAAENAPKVPPNQSLYIQNLSEKLQKEDLRRELYMLFSTYGPVLDVTVVKSRKMRGQAHVLFRDVHSATQALRSCNAMEFLGRDVKISYSRNRSKTLSKLTGTVNAPATTTIQTTEAQSGATAAPTSFPAPPRSLPAPPTGLPPPPGLPGPPKINGAVKVSEEVASPQGVKRTREESDDEDEAPMEEDDDEEGGEMEMSDED